MNHVQTEMPRESETTKSIFNIPEHAQLSLLPSSEVVPVHAVTHDQNTHQKLVTVTEDKMLLCLNRHLKYIGRKRWVQPLSLLATLLLALATSEFDKLRWVSADLLTAIFIVASFVTAAWLIWAITHTSRSRDIPEVVDDICAELRGKCEEETPGSRLALNSPEVSSAFSYFVSKAHARCCAS